MNPPPGAAPSRLGLVLGFAAVYLIWGSTYLAIRFAVETLPPFWMAAFRHGVTGLAMYAWLRRRGEAPPTREQWRQAVVVGTLLLLGGNGLVSWAEQWVPSGLTALIIASVPLCMGAMSWLVEPSARPGARGIAGVLIGFGGVAFLVGPGGEIAADPRTLLGALSLVVACVAWAAGSLLARRRHKPKSPFLATAMQMIAGGAALAVVGALAGEWRRVDLASVSTVSALSLLYLMTFGSLIGFSAYVWLLQATTPAKVSTYAYVNPVVAVFLGWAFADESVTAHTAVAAAIILFSVVLITTERRGPSGAAAPAPTPPRTTRPRPAAGSIRGRPRIRRRSRHRSARPSSSARRARPPSRR
ncbi:MAG: EamA family transporter [Candidatus Eiseniibacteriota bacterium]